MSKIPILQDLVVKFDEPWPKSLRVSKMKPDAKRTVIWLSKTGIGITPRALWTGSGEVRGGFLKIKQKCLQRYCEVLQDYEYWWELKIRGKQEFEKELKTVLTAIERLTRDMHQLWKSPKGGRPKTKGQRDRLINELMLEEPKSNHAQLVTKFKERYGERYGEIDRKIIGIVLKRYKPERDFIEYVLLYLQDNLKKPKTYAGFLEFERRLGFGPSDDTRIFHT